MSGTVLRALLAGISEFTSEIDRQLTLPANYIVCWYFYGTPACTHGDEIIPAQFVGRCETLYETPVTPAEEDRRMAASFGAALAVTFDSEPSPDCAEVGENTPSPDAKLVTVRLRGKDVVFNDQPENELPQVVSSLIAEIWPESAKN